MRTMLWLVFALMLAAPPAEDSLERLTRALDDEDYQTAAPLLETLLDEHLLTPGWVAPMTPSQGTARLWSSIPPWPRRG
jgi:hypothetical protein